MRIGVIGCGIWGQKIIQALIRLKAEVMVHDIDPGTEKILPRSISFFNQMKAFIQAPKDACIIATPATTHRAILEILHPLEQPVFVEKPLVVSLDDAHALENLDQGNIYVMHIWKYHPGIQLLAEVIKDGQLGTIKSARSLRLNWTSPRQDVDSIWNLVPHDLTIADCLFGYLPEPSFAIAEEYHGVARSMLAILGKQPHYHIEVSNRHWKKSREVRVHGAEGIAILKDEKVDYIEMYLGNEHSMTSDVRIEKIFFDNSMSPLERELDAFLAYVRGGAPPVSNLAEGIRIIKAVIKLRKLAGLKV